VAPKINTNVLGVNRHEKFEWMCDDISKSWGIVSLTISRGFSFGNDRAEWKVEIRTNSNAMSVEECEVVTSCLVEASRIARGLDLNEIEDRFQAADKIRQARYEEKRAIEKAAREEAEAADPAFGEDRVAAELNTALKAMRKGDINNIIVRVHTRCSDRTADYRVVYGRYSNLTVEEIQIVKSGDTQYLRTVSEQIAQRDLKDMLARASHKSQVITMVNHAERQAWMAQQ
jgi:hypothetical protein